MPENRIDKTAEYIRLYKSKYTYLAINQELTKQGYTVEEIEEGWSRVGVAYEDTARTKDDTDDEWFWTTFFAFLLGVPVTIGIISALTPSDNAAATLFMWLLPLALVIGLIASAVLWRTKHGVAKGLLTGVIMSVVLPFIPLIIIIGICSITHPWNI